MIEEKDGVLWTEAERAVGEDDPGADWKLNPLAHAENLPPSAARLRHVLTQPGLQALMEGYVASDLEAGDMQTRYRAACRWLNRFALSAFILGLLGFGAYVWRGVGDLQLALILGHALSVFAAAWQLGRLRRKDWRRSWKRARGKAEAYRIEIFSAACSAAAPGALEAEALPGPLLPLGPLQLAYFRRYQLDVQIRYYCGRGKQLRKDRTPPWLSIPAIALTAAILALVLALLLAIWAEQGGWLPAAATWIFAVDAQWIASFALYAMVLPIAYALVVRDVEPREDDANAERFKAQCENLSFLRKVGYAPAQKAARNDDLSVAEALMGMVHERMRAEHEQWLLMADGDATTAKVSGLEAFLRKAAEAGGEP